MNRFTSLTATAQELEGMLNIYDQRGLEPAFAPILLPARNEQEEHHFYVLLKPKKGEGTNVPTS